MGLDFSLYFDIDTGNEPLRHEVFTQYITHNLTPMAKLCGAYESLWRPGDKTADDIYNHLINSMRYLVTNEEKCKALEPENGFGSYWGFVDAVDRIKSACAKYPKAKIDACV